MDNPYERFLATVDAVAQRITIDGATIEQIKVPERTHIVSIPLTRDDGTLELYTG